VMIQRSSCRM